MTSLPLVAKRMNCDYDIAAMNAFLELFGYAIMNPFRLCDDVGYAIMELFVESTIVGLFFPVSEVEETCFT